MRHLMAIMGSVFILPVKYETEKLYVQTCAVSRFILKRYSCGLMKFLTNSITGPKIIGFTDDLFILFFSVWYWHVRYF